MNIGIESNILRYCLRDVYFITGSAYAGKSTMARLLAEKHGMIHCGENYHEALAAQMKTVKLQPNLCYFETMRDWQEFISRTPEEYGRWIEGCSREAAQIELAQLLRLSAAGKKIVVDTNIPLEILREISDYGRVAVMLSPPELSVERFFDREDEDKRFILRQIQSAPDPVGAMENYRACLARVNSKERCDAYKNSGFFVLMREDDERDTRQEVLERLERHFHLC